MDQLFSGWFQKSKYLDNLNTCISTSGPQGHLALKRRPKPTDLSGTPDGTQHPVDLPPVDTFKSPFQPDLAGRPGRSTCWRVEMNDLDDVGPRSPGLHPKDCRAEQSTASDDRSTEGQTEDL